MRSLRVLLSVGAMLGLAVGSANASRILGQEGNPATPTGTGLVNELDGFQEMGSPYTGGQGLETETAMPFSVPAPGTVNMRINSFVNEFPMVTWYSGQNGNGTPRSNAGNKLQPFGIYGWIRVDIGLDGQTKNGIKYGAFTEIRENNTTNVTGGPTSLNGGFGQGASADSSGNTLYVRHAFVYIGQDQVGFLRIGTGTPVMTVFETGLTDDFDIGGWNSLSSTSIPSAMTPVWPWADNGNGYMMASITYLSPVYAGFDFGLGFVPNNSPPFDGSGCSQAFGGVGCATQSSSTFAGDIQNRYRNMFSGALRYRNSFGPVGMNISGIASVGGRVNGAVPNPAGGHQQYDDIRVYDVGAQFSLFKQWDVEGNVIWGNFNGAWALQPRGGHDALGWVVGTKYTIPQAPLTIGAYYFDYRYNGTQFALTSGQGARTSRGLDVGAVYGLGPGVVLLAEYAWGEVAQNGVNLLSGTDPRASNKVWAQVLTAGMSIRF